jgi:hypothetical protein
VNRAGKEFAMTAREIIFVAVVVAMAGSGVGLALFMVHQSQGLEQQIVQVR